MRPQDLPASLTLLALVLGAHTLVGMIVSSANLRFGQAIAVGVTDTALLCVLTAALLMLHKQRERIIQTLIALAGAGSVIGFFVYPASLWLHDAREAGEQALMPTVLLLAMLGWSLVVSGHILRHALSVPYYVGLLVSVGLYWLSVKILSSLLPIGGPIGG